MHRKTPVRLLMAAALAAGTLTTVALAAPSGAATKVTCTKEVSTKPKTAGGIITVKVTLTGCSASVGGRGNGTTTIKAGKTTNKITWAGGKGTTTQQVQSYVGQKSRGKCKAGESRLLITSKVTAGTGAAAKVIKKGTIDKSYSCEKADGSSYNEPGSKVTF